MGRADRAPGGPKGPGGGTATSHETAAQEPSGADTDLEALGNGFVLSILETGIESSVQDAAERGPSAQRMSLCSQADEVSDAEEPLRTDKEVNPVQPPQQTLPLDPATGKPRRRSLREESNWDMRVAFVPTAAATAAAASEAEGGSIPTPQKRRSLKEDSTWDMKLAFIPTAAAKQELVGEAKGASESEPSANEAEVTAKELPVPQHGSSYESEEPARTLFVAPEAPKVEEVEPYSGSQSLRQSRLQRPAPAESWAQAGIPPGAPDPDYRRAPVPPSLPRPEPPTPSYPRWRPATEADQRCGSWLPQQHTAEPPKARAGKPPPGPTTDIQTLVDYWMPPAMEGPDASSSPSSASMSHPEHQVSKRRQKIYKGGAQVVQYPGRRPLQKVGLKMKKFEEPLPPLLSPQELEDWRRKLALSVLQIAKAWDAPPRALRLVR